MTAVAAPSANAHPVGETTTTAGAATAASTAGAATAATRPQTGATTSRIVRDLGADLWHSAGFRGAGIKVGILAPANSTTWVAQEATGDVPAFNPATHSFCRRGGLACQAFNDDQPTLGNVLAEAVIEIAPDAELFLGEFDTDSDLRSVLSSFGAKGVRVVLDPNVYDLDGPGDGTGPKQSVVNSIIARTGLLYVKAVGDVGTRRFWRNNLPLTFDANGYVRFNGTDTTLGIEPENGCFSMLGVRWNDWGVPATRTNYDTELFINGIRVGPSPTSPDQTKGALPIELAGVGHCGVPAGHTVGLKIRKRTATVGTVTGDIIEVRTFGGLLEHWQDTGTAGTPVSDSTNPSVLVVGGAEPPNGLASSTQSQGPTIDGRLKPDMTAYTCMTVSLRATCFNGSDMAAAVATGMVALMLDADLAANNAGLLSLIRAHLVNRGLPGPDTIYGSGLMRLPPTPQPVNTHPGAYTAITPIRLLDSRSAALSPPGTAGRYAPRRLVRIPIRSTPIPGTKPPVVPVPAGATAVAVNLTVVRPIHAGFTQLMPYLGSPVESSATLNVMAAEQVQPNFAIVPIGTNDSLAIYTTSGGYYVIDILGYFSPVNESRAGRFVPLKPSRVLDTSSTRAALLPAGWVAHKPVAGETVTYTFAAGGAVPASGAGAVVLSITGDRPSANGYVTVFPNGKARPVASVLNLVAGRNATNQIIVPLGAARAIKLFTSGGTHLSVDLVGYFTDGAAPIKPNGRFVPISPGRAFDSREAGSTVVGASSRRRIQVAGSARVAVPAAGVLAVSANVTATRQTAAGRATVFNDDLAIIPSTTSLAWPAPNFTIASASIIHVSKTGGITISPTVKTDLVVDIYGYFTK